MAQLVHRDQLVPDLDLVRGRQERPDNRVRPVPMVDKDRLAQELPVHRVQWVQPDPQPVQDLRERPVNEVQPDRRV